MFGGTRPLRFGLSVTPNAADYSAIVAQVAAAERGGLDLVGIQDHPYQARFLDTFALIGDLLARTETIRIFPDVASLPMRYPTMLAKAAASLDVMSGGRFELGIGAGAFWEAVAGMGGPNRASGDRFEALEEAITLIRAALDVDAERRVVRSAGPNYTLPGYQPGPPPAPRVEIWIGAMAGRSLEIIGRLADGWIPGAGTARVDRLPELADRIAEGARGAGRDPDGIRRILNLSGVVTPGHAVARTPLVGPPSRWVETLSDWAIQLGVDSFVYWPPDPDPIHIHRFAGEVAPAVREVVARSPATDPRPR